MTIKGMRAWMDYVVRQFDLSYEEMPGGSRYLVPEKYGRGYMRSFDQPGVWSIWICDFTMNKELKASYMQDDCQSLLFAYREGFDFDGVPSVIWPGKKALHVDYSGGLSLRAIGVCLFVPFFQRFSQQDIMDFLSSIQSYDDTIIMKQIRPVLRQMLARPGDGASLRLFMESRVLEITSILIDLAEKERNKEKISLSPFDISQLHKVIEILEKHLTNPPGISELARLAALNEYKLKTGFRQLFGTTIYEYLRLLRMEKAVELLKDKQLAADEVGRCVGYKTPHGFSNVFRKFYGMSPAEWQSQR